MRAITQFLDMFADLQPMPNAENLYHPSTPEGVLRCKNVELYLRLLAKQHPRVAIIGEAPGYQGLGMDTPKTASSGTRRCDHIRAAAVRDSATKRVIPCITGRQPHFSLPGVEHTQEYY